MSACPLTELDLVKIADPNEGWIWQPNIPDECYLCLNAVSEAVKATVFHHPINDETGRPFNAMQDRYFIRGIQPMDNEGGRLGIEETGIDQGSGYDGPKEAESIFGFSCLCS